MRGSVAGVAGVIAAFALCGVAAAEPAAVGTTLPQLELLDPHGEPGRVDRSTRVVLFSRDMDGGRVIQRALEKEGAARLRDSGAVYVSDVSRMPGFVRRFIAGPRMKKRPYPMLLDPDGAATASLPSQEGKATLLRIDALTVTEVLYLDSSEALLGALTGPGETDGSD